MGLALLHFVPLATVSEILLMYRTLNTLVLRVIFWLCYLHISIPPKRLLSMSLPLFISHLKKGFSQNYSVNYNAHQNFRPIM